MIPAKIEDVFIQLTTNFSGSIISIDAGKFVKKEFQLKESIYTTCPFLEGTLEALPLKESFLIEGMVVESNSKEYNVDLELFKNDVNVVVLIHNRTNVYKYVDQLNQNRNDIFFIKREIAEKNKELERLRKIADKANEEKSRFLAMMSHEVRNPLNAILGYAEMISDEKTNDNVKNYIQYLTSAGKNLKVIVDDILDLSRIEAGKLDFVIEKFSIKESVTNCIANFKHLHTNKEVKLLFTVSENVPKLVLGDAVRLTQILSNLISNAIKFTKKGEIKTEVTIKSEEENKAIISFKISDTGRGMTQQQISKVFEEYQQSEIDDNRVHGGAGLGLAIVKRIVTAMNGTINVESNIDVGTTFFIDIPFEKTSVNSLKSKEIEFNKTAISLKGKRILVADDDVLNQTIVAHILKKEEVELTLVNDGLEAQNKLKNNTYDLVLLDINMPNVTGEDLVKQKKEFSKFNSSTPIFALTANTTKEDIERYLLTGFSNIISKPFTAKEFLEKVKSVFE